MAKEGPTWRVVGGKQGGGIVVREGRSITSPQTDDRLGYNALVLQLSLVGERLQYKLLEGTGPVTGWVSLKLKGADLVVREDGEAAEPEPMKEVKIGDFQVVLKARPRTDSDADLHVVCAVLCESGHMLPMLRIAKAVAARSTVQKVTYMTNTLGSKKVRGWVKSDPLPPNMEVVAIEDGWDEAMQEKADMLAQNEDGSLHNLLSEQMGTNSVKYLKSLEAGEKRPDLFVVDAATWGVTEALKKSLEMRPPILASSALSAMVYPIIGLSNLTAEQLKELQEKTNGGAVDPNNAQQFADAVEESAYGEEARLPEMVHCFDLPGPMKEALPAMPKHAITVGIIADEVKLGQLPDALNKFVEKDGPPIIYVSMGSVSSFSKEQLTKFSQALKTDNEWRVIWSLNKKLQDLLPGGVAALGDKFHVSSWLPQAELLQHPKVVAFVSHCGWGASCEAIVSGKPVIGFPMFADQYSNAILLDAFGMCKTVNEDGIGMDTEKFKSRMERATGVRTGEVKHTRDAFTVEGFRDDIRTVIKNKTYGAKAMGIKFLSKQSGGGAKKAGEVVETHCRRQKWEPKDAPAKVIEPEEEEPEDGVMRPPAGLKPPTRPRAAAGKEATLPDWLVPDGDPPKKNRILFLSLPFKGHIIHLTRLAEWFGERPKYEVHFGCFSMDIPALPKECKVHCADEVEMTDLFDEFEDQLKALAMKPVDKMGLPLPPEPGQELEDSKDSNGEAKKSFGERMATEGVKVLRFMLRVMSIVKPNVVVADSSFEIGGYVQALCKVFGNSQCMFVKSPGIREAWTNEGNQASKKANQEQLVQASQGSPGNVGAATMAAAGGYPNGGASAGAGGANSAAAAAAADGGGSMMDMIKANMPPGTEILLSIPKLEPMRLIQIFSAIQKVASDPPPIQLYPSAEWMVEDNGDPHEIFTGPFLPLPVQTDGKVQVGKDNLVGSIPPELLDWMYDAEDTRPIVYVAFGTIVQGFKAVVDKIAEALAEGEWRVLWSLPKDMQQWLPSDLDQKRWRIEPFVPQKEVFRCDRVKCFISHCGANSTTEAMSCGVPMICHPFYMDQMVWAENVRKYLRAGIKVDKFKSDAAAVRRAVTEVLRDDAYRENAQLVSKQLREEWEALKSAIGPSMTPKANLGPGVSVVAAMMISIMKGKDPRSAYGILGKLQ